MQSVLIFVVAIPLLRIVLTVLEDLDGLERSGISTPQLCLEDNLPGSSYRIRYRTIVIQAVCLRYSDNQTSPGHRGQRACAPT